MDISSMYLIVIFMFLYNFARLGRMKSRVFVFYYFLLMIGLGSIVIAFPNIRRIIFGLTILIALISEILILLKFKIKMRMSYLCMGIVIAVVGFIAWVIDNENVICFPDCWFSGHTIWHILTPVATGFIYMYYRHENSRLDDNKTNLI